MKTFLMLALLSVFLAPPVAAQVRYVGEIGVGMDSTIASPHTTADAGVLIGNGTNWSYSRLVARGPQDKRFSFLFESGYRRELVSFYSGKLAAYTEGLGGVAQNNTAVSGSVSGKGGIVWHKTSTLGFDIGGGVTYSPVDNGLRPAITVRVMFTPKQ